MRESPRRVRPRLPGPITCVLLSWLLCGAWTVAGVGVIETIVADNGDDDGYADTNETVQLSLQIQNTGLTRLTSVSVQLSTTSPHIECIATSEFHVGELDAGETRVVGPFVFKVADVDRLSLGLDELDALSASFDVRVISDQDAVDRPRVLTLDLDLDVSGGSAPSSYFEGFEVSSGLASFTTMNLDFGLNSDAASDGYRCQYSDPDYINSNSYGAVTDCYLGPFASAAEEYHWQINGPGSPDNGRSFSGTRSLYMGIYGAAPDENTTPMAVLEAVRTTDPINIGWNRVCSISRATPCVDPVDCPGGEDCVDVAPALTIKHQISLMDWRTVSVPETESADRAVVQVQFADEFGDPVGHWIQLEPYRNVYDRQGTDNYTNCLFDPVDDGSTEDDFFDPADPQRRLGPSSTCYPTFSFTHMGDTFSPFAPGNLGRADGPGLAGASGVGTWVESRFNLDRFRGRRVRLRFLNTSLKAGTFVDYEQIFAHNPDPGDDGWWIDDVEISDTLTVAATTMVDLAANDSLPGMSDGDGDGRIDACDICPATIDPLQADLDLDGRGDACDNCPADVNPGQENADLDLLGDACDRCPNGDMNDSDNDLHPCLTDNCPVHSNAAQLDGDGDGHGDACDVCPADPENDVDGDGTCGDVDNCATRFNPEQGAAVRFVDSKPLPGDVDSWVYSPDGQHVVFLADRDTPGIVELYRVPADGGAPTRLNGDLVPDGQVDTFDISPDSSTVVYRADQDTEGTVELYSVPIAGGAAVRLNPDLTAGGSVRNPFDPGSHFRFSPDGSTVVYLADQEVDTRVELYAVPVLGGASVKLNTVLTEHGDVLQFEIAPDSANVAYIADAIQNGVDELFSVPIGGGVSVQLSPTPTDGGEVNDLTGFSPDGSFVVYLADVLANGQQRLLRAPVAGGSTIGLSPPTVSVELFPLPRLTPSAAHVVFVTDDSIYSTTLSGASKKLNTTVFHGGIHWFLFSPNETWVVYRAAPTGGSPFELYRSTIGGGELKLNAQLVPGGSVFSAFISPDSSRVVYLADQDTDDMVEAYSVFTNGGVPPVKLNGPLHAGGDVSLARIGPDSSTVIYRADQDTEAVDELYRVPIDATVPPEKLSGSMVNGGNATSFAFTTDGARVVYRADQVFDEVHELFAADLDPDADGDGVLALCECNDAEGSVYPGAQEINDGLDNQCPGDPGHGATDELSGVAGFHDPGNPSEFSWSAQPGATLYEVVRSTLVTFSGDCTSTTTSGTSWIDAAVPPSGGRFHYLARALEPNAGSWGQNSNGQERTVDCLP